MLFLKSLFSVFSVRLKVLLGLRWAMCCVVLLLATVQLAWAQVDEEDEQQSAEPFVNSDLTDKQFFDILTGFMYLTQRDAGAAYSHILRAARSTNDGKLFQYAMEIGWGGKSPQRAQRAAKEWVSAQPSSIKAARTLVQVSVEGKRYRDSIRPLQQLFGAIPENKVGPIILFSTRYYQRAASKEETKAVDAFEKAVRPYIKTGNPKTKASALAAVARLRWLAQQDEESVKKLEQARNVAPRSDHVALVAMEMASQGSEPANTMLRLYMRDNPNVPADIGLQYARLLIDKRQSRLAIKQLQNVTRLEKDNAQAWLLLTALQEEEGLLEQAEQSGKRFLSIAKKQQKKRGKQAADASESDEEPALLRDPLEQDEEAISVKQIAQVQLLLSGIASKKGDNAEAERWLGKVDRSVFKDASLVTEQRAMMLAKQNRMDEALKLVQALPDDVRTPAQKLDTEVGLYLATKQYARAYNSSLKLLELKPENPSVLYNHAILAERVERFDEMERHMRKLMELDPKGHDAYNALGYSLAVRNIRLDEAKELIEKALSMVPGNPYVTDSLAWVEYKLGNTTRALALLKEVFEQKTDPEIAAHYGEVLYVSGQKEKAAAIWREALQTVKGKDNKALKETMQRFNQPMP